MKNYFKRQIKLWGDDTQNSLKTKSIAIIGAGGLGNSLGMMLGSSGIGKIYIVDFDRVAIHNIHRQFSFTLADKGKFKSEVLRDFILARNPFVEVEAIVGSFTQFDKDVDLILDATDNFQTRAEIDRYAKLHNLPWIYTSVEDWNGHICFFEKQSFSIFNITDKKPGGVLPHMVAMVASVESDLAIRYLAGYEIKKDTLYYIYHKNMTLEFKEFEIG
jgi:molybdopterin/thiamine biosynthesis adenylyltransferase